METKVLRCSCAHAYQDEKYGHGMRLHNTGPKGKSGVTARCTVCGTKKVV